MTFFHLPKGFRLGAATSSYQIEGAALEDGKGESIWDAFCSIPGKIERGETGAIAADHYHRYEEDIALMRDIGIKHYRFSLSWPRIIPEGIGPVNQKGIAFYDRLIDALLNQGIEPMITLYHWDLPQALSLKGGWLTRQTAESFADYAAICFRKFQDRVKLWVTINEPSVAANAGYQSGIHAPGLSLPQGGMTAGHHFLLAHALSLEKMREIGKAKIGIALNLSPVFPANPSIDDDCFAAKLYHDRLYGFYLEALFKGKYPESLQLPLEAREADLPLISQPIDFLGVNYYTKSTIAGVRTFGEIIPQPAAHLPNPYSDLWTFYPQGLREVLEAVHEGYRCPEIMVLENGTSLPEINDENRIAYLKAHLSELDACLLNGIPVTGYYVWSLLDNFEWHLGFSRRFGLIHVDYKTLKRTLKKSAYWYKELLQERSYGSM